MKMLALKAMKPYYDHKGITIYHGDCLEILPELEPVDLVLTDPPYGTKTNQREIFMPGEFSNVMPLALPLIYNVLVDNGAFYCFSSWSLLADWLLRYQQYFKLQNIIIWDKEKHSGCYSSQSWQFTWEAIIYGIKGKRNIKQYIPDLVRTKERGRRRAMQKPVDILKTCITASAGLSVLDPFMGSGSTLVAAQSINIPGIGIDISEQQCEIAARRLAQEMLPFGSNHSLETDGRKDGHRSAK